MDPIGVIHAARHEYRIAWLSVLGRADLRGGRDAHYPFYRPAADQAVLPASAYGGRFPFLARAASRIYRTGRAFGRRGRGEKHTRRAFWGIGRQLPRRHLPSYAGVCVYPDIQPA